MTPDVLSDPTWPPGMICWQGLLDTDYSHLLLYLNPGILVIDLPLNMLMSTDLQKCLDPLHATYKREEIGTLFLGHSSSQILPPDQHCSLQIRPGTSSTGLSFHANEWRKGAGKKNLPILDFSSTLPTHSVKSHFSNLPVFPSLSTIHQLKGTISPFPFLLWKKLAQFPRDTKHQGLAVMVNGCRKESQLPTKEHIARNIYSFFPHYIYTSHRLEPIIVT